MSLISTIAGIFPDTHQMAPVPIVERIRAQVAEQEALIPGLQAAVEEANFQNAVLPGADTDSALSLAQAGLDQATTRRDKLKAALATATQKAVAAAADDTERARQASLRKLEAHCTTLKRKIKAHAVELERVVRSHAEMLAAAEQVVKAFPANVRTPTGHMLTYVELAHATRQELCRVTALRDPTTWARVGDRSHFMGISPAMAGAFHKSGSGSLPTMEAHGAQAMGSLMNIARGLPFAPARDHTAALDPALPNPADQVKASDISPVELARMKAELAAEQVWDAVPGATKPEPMDLAAQKAAWATLQDPAEPELRGEELETLAAAWNANNSDPDAREEWAATQQPVTQGDE